MFHRRCSFSVQSILENGLIPGGKESDKALQTVFFTPLNHFGENPNEGAPSDDFTIPKTAHYHSHWKRNQDAVYWVISVLTLLVFRSTQGGVCAQLLFLIKVLQVDLCTFMCHAESHIVSSTSNCCSFECSRKVREARICFSSQLDGCRRLRTCHPGCGRSRRMQGAGDGAPSRRAPFDGHSVECTWQRGESEPMDVWARGVFCRGESADRGHVHLCTKGHSGCHVGDHDLHCLEWRVVPRGEKHPT